MSTPLFFGRHPCASPLVVDASPDTSNSPVRSLFEPSSSANVTLTPVVRQALSAAVSLSIPSHTPSPSFSPALSSSASETGRHSSLSPDAPSFTPGSTPSPSFSHSQTHHQTFGQRSDERKGDRSEREHKASRQYTHSHASHHTPRSVTVVQHFYFGPGADAPRVSPAQYPWQSGSVAPRSFIPAAAPSAFDAPVRPLASRVSSHTSLPLSPAGAFTPIRPAVQTQPAPVPSAVFSDLDSTPDAVPSLDASPFCLTLNPKKPPAPARAFAVMQEKRLRDAVMAEIDQGNFFNALVRLNEYLEKYPDKYPLHHLKLHLLQEIGTLQYPPEAFILTSKALNKDLQWRWHVNQSQYYANQGNWKEAHAALSLAEKTISFNNTQTWKLPLLRAILHWQSGEKLPVVDGVLKHLYHKCPLGDLHTHELIIPMAAIYQLFGEVEIAVKILDECAQKLESMERIKLAWRPRLEQIYALARGGYIREAEELLLKLEPLYQNQAYYWALRVQLIAGNTPEEVLKISQLLVESARNFETVQKSGEMLCEYARFLMNPTKLRPSPHHPFYIEYDLERAEQALEKAIELTPQFADSHIELMRLYKIKGALELSSLKDPTPEKMHAIHAKLNRSLEAVRTRFLHVKSLWGHLYKLCLNSAEQFRCTTWKIAEARVDQHLAYLRTVESEAPRFELHSNAFGRGLCHMHREINEFAPAQKIRLFVDEHLFDAEAVPRD